LLRFANQYPVFRLCPGLRIILGLASGTGDGCEIPATLFFILIWQLVLRLPRRVAGKKGNPLRLLIHLVGTRPRVMACHLPVTSSSFLVLHHNRPSPMSSKSSSPTYSSPEGISYRTYAGERDLPSVINLVQNELSEPYVVYTYRYFLQGW